MTSQFSMNRMFWCVAVFGFCNLFIFEAQSQGYCRRGTSCTIIVGSFANLEAPYYPPPIYNLRMGGTPDAIEQTAVSNGCTDATIVVAEHGSTDPSTGRHGFVVGQPDYYGKCSRGYRDGNVCIEDSRNFQAQTSSRLSARTYRRRFVISSCQSGAAGGFDERSSASDASSVAREYSRCRQSVIGRLCPLYLNTSIPAGAFTDAVRSCMPIHDRGWRQVPTVLTPVPCPDRGYVIGSQVQPCQGAGCSRAPGIQGGMAPRPWR